ncbi:hypothetical protein [Brevibacillus sedimenti]|uniref:hypothetical protein n=1 Tax=Brevibacillus sedimenti TaxID=2613334 RepID=UPI001E57E8D5|nr:hypothetical protein [Anoxybacillus sediminis]UFJ61450.1 hypothetical protein IRT44_00885 [Anoxybacillus sediminis]
MSRKRVKVAAGLFTIVASLSFFTTSAFANFLGGKWEISNIIYENINLEKKYSRVLWTAVDKWNGISSSFDLSPADSDETGYVAVNADFILTHHRRFRIDPPGDFLLVRW